MADFLHDRWAILNGDASRILDEKVRPGSIDCCITSPPYFNLRDYGTGRWTGGDEGCDHEGDDVCPKCGARWTDEQIGMEGTPQEFVEALVGTFRSVRRALKDSGTLWVNVGDCYCNTNGFHRRGRNMEYRRCVEGAMANGRDVAKLRQAGYKVKDLIGVPWMLAFALREDGWYLRSDVVWRKTNPAPEKAYDRLVRSHEFLFLLSKSQKYYFDDEAVRNPNGSRLRDVWDCAVQTAHGDHYATYPEKLIEPCVLASSPENGVVMDCFSGMATTGLVALKNGRRYLGIDLSEKYCRLSDERLTSAGF